MVGYRSDIWRVRDNGSKLASTVGDGIRELQLPVEEVFALGDLARGAQGPIILDNALP